MYACVCIYVYIYIYMYKQLTGTSSASEAPVPARSSSTLPSEVHNLHSCLAISDAGYVSEVRNSHSCATPSKQQSRIRCGIRFRNLGPDWSTLANWSNSRGF